jgi:hypothetical protein
MLTLLKREIRDNAVFFLAAALFAMALVLTALSIAHNIGQKDVHIAALALLMPTSVILISGFVAMGVSQMRIDRNTKISFFLTTLPVSRNQILIARIITAILAILVLLIPLAITAIFIMKIYPLPYPLPYPAYVSEIFIAVFLTAFACYCIGLQLGWSSSLPGTVIGGIAFTITLASMIFIKGFGPDLWIILLLFITASLTRTWQKFNSNIL